MQQRAEVVAAEIQQAAAAQAADDPDAPPPQEEELFDAYVPAHLSSAASPTYQRARSSSCVVLHRFTATAPSFASCYADLCVIGVQGSADGAAHVQTRPDVGEGSCTARGVREVCET
jgi:hypothetical protein